MSQRDSRRRDTEKAMRAFARLMAGDDPAAVMREAEVARGHKLVPVGSVAWLPAQDWGARDVVSTHGSEVRLVAIGARQPRNGAFTQLLAGIAAAGLRPVVICPLFTMTAILIHWGWDCVAAGHSFETREEQWRPPPGWQARTRAAAPEGPVVAAGGETRAGGPVCRPGGEIAGDGDG